MDNIVELETLQKQLTEARQETLQWKNTVMSFRQQARDKVDELQRRINEEIDKSHYLRMEVQQLRSRLGMKQKYEDEFLSERDNILYPFSEDFIAVDFETATNTRMACQIGIAVVKNGEIVETITRFIQPPDNHYDKECQKIHHISEDMTMNSPSFIQVWQEIEYYFLTAKEIWAHNADFDSDVIRQNLALHGLAAPSILEKFHCTMELFFGIGLHNLCQAYDMNTTGHHDAGFDARCCAQFRLNFINGIEPNWWNCYDLKRPMSDISIATRELFKKREYLLFGIEEKVFTIPEPTDKLAGHCVFISGVFSLYTRDDYAVIFESMGAKTTTKINKETSIALLGEMVREDIREKIERLSIRVISETEAKSLIDGTTLSQ